MSKKTAFRFFVADKERCSLTWSLTIQQNDIYISHSGSRQDKISLHESGTYQWSVRSEHVESVPFAKDNRHIARWNNPPHPAGSLTRQFFVLIPTSELELNRPRPLKQATYLQPPPIGWATYIHFVFFTPDTGKHVTSAEWTPKPLFEAKLASGQILLVVRSEIPLDQATRTKLEAVKDSARRDEKYGKKAARALAKLTDPQGVSGLAEVVVKSSQPMVSPSTAETSL
ncbi:hypothetical protein AB3K92_32885 [Burkholderia sp. Bmkn7]|uniref:hypothetical protein n=1 Tax=Burkholderia sp. Bmkn7 TaxID=3236841 RepID=UPI0034E568BF